MGGLQWGNTSLLLLFNTTSLKFRLTMGKSEMETVIALRFKHKIKQGHYITNLKISPKPGKRTFIAINHSPKTDKVKTHIQKDNTYMYHLNHINFMKLSKLFGHFFLYICFLQNPSMVKEASDVTSFTELKLNSKLLTYLELEGIKKPTNIQVPMCIILFLVIPWL